MIRIFLFGEAHIEYFNYFSEITHGAYSISVIAQKIKNREIAVKILENSEEYISEVSKFCKKVRKFYSVIKELLDKKKYNVLFHEGCSNNFDESLADRGIEKGLFKELYWLDNRDYRDKIDDNNYMLSGRERVWKENLFSFLNGKKDVSVVCIVGKKHLRKKSVFSKEHLEKELLNKGYKISVEERNFNHEFSDKMEELAFIFSQYQHKNCYK